MTQPKVADVCEERFYVQVTGMELQGIDQVGGDYICYPRRIKLTHDMDRV
jgi:hypothetical protein